MGGIGETWRFRTAKLVPLRHPRWPPRWEALGRHGDLELLNHFVTISTMAATAAILKIFNCQLSVNHGPLSACPSATFFDISIRIISMMAVHLESLQLLSAPEP